MRTIEPVGEHARAAGDAAAVAAAFADDRGAFAGDGAFIDRGDALDDFAVAGNLVAGFDEHEVAHAAGRARERTWLRPASPDAGSRAAAVGLPTSSSSFLAATFCRVALSASAWALPRPSAIASAKLANSTVNQSHRLKRRRRTRAIRRSPPDEPLDQEQRRGDAADEHGEHHRVADLVARVELDERIGDRPAHNRRIEQGTSFGGGHSWSQWSGSGQ